MLYLYLQMGIHLMKTHLVMEAFAVASWRQLPSIHPVFQLLFPHLRSVMAINTIGMNELIAKGGMEALEAEVIFSY